MGVKSAVFRFASAACLAVACGACASSPPFPPHAPDHDFRLVLDIGSLDGRTFDPAAFVRAANDLIDGGEVSAYDRLRALLGIVPVDWSSESHDGAHVEACTLLALALVLWPPTVAEFRLPPTDCPSDPRYPLFFVGELPLCAPMWSDVGYDAFERAEWFYRLSQKYRFRRTHLEPPDDPIAAAEFASERLALPPSAESPRGSLALDNDVRRQAWRALGDLVPLPRSSLDRRSHRWPIAGPIADPITDAEWTSLKDVVHALGGVHWDAEEQRYVAGSRAPRMH